MARPKLKYRFLGPASAYFTMGIGVYFITLGEPLFRVPEFFVLTMFIVGMVLVFAEGAVLRRAPGVQKYASDGEGKTVGPPFLLFVTLVGAAGAALVFPIRSDIFAVAAVAACLGYCVYECSQMGGSEHTFVPQAWMHASVLKYLCDATDQVGLVRTVFVGFVRGMLTALGPVLVCFATVAAGQTTAQLIAPKNDSLLTFASVLAAGIAPGICYLTLFSFLSRSVFERALALGIEIPTKIAVYDSFADRIACRIQPIVSGVNRYFLRRAISKSFDRELLKVCVATADDVETVADILRDEIYIRTDCWVPLVRVKGLVQESISGETDRTYIVTYSGHPLMLGFVYVEQRSLKLNEWFGPIEMFGFPWKEVYDVLLARIKSDASELPASFGYAEGGSDFDTRYLAKLVPETTADVANLRREQERQQKIARHETFRLATLDDVENIADVQYGHICRDVDVPVSRLEKNVIQNLEQPSKAAYYVACRNNVPFAACLVFKSPAAWIVRNIYEGHSWSFNRTAKIVKSLLLEVECDACSSGVFAMVVLGHRYELVPQVSDSARDERAKYITALVNLDFYSPMMAWEKKHISDHHVESVVLALPESDRVLEGDVPSIKSYLEQLEDHESDERAGHDSLPQAEATSDNRYWQPSVAGEPAEAGICTPFYAEVGEAGIDLPEGNDRCGTA